MTGLTLTTATTAFVGHRRGVTQGLETYGGQKPLPCQQAANHWDKEQNHSSENPNATRDSYVGLTEMDQLVKRRKLCHHPKARSRSWVPAVGISSGAFLQRKVLCALPYQNKVKMVSKTSKQTSKQP